MDTSPNRILEPPPITDLYTLLNIYNQLISIANEGGSTSPELTKATHKLEKYIAQEVTALCNPLKEVTQ